MPEEYFTNPKIQQSEPPRDDSKRRVGGWLIWLTLILIYPLGLILLWIFSGWSAKKKLLITFIVPIIIVIIFSSFYFFLIHNTLTSWEKNNQKQVEETKNMLNGGKQATSTPNADTETLTNAKYNYSFNYTKEIYMKPGTSPEMIEFSTSSGDYNIDVQSYEIKSGTKVEDIIDHPENDSRVNYHKISQEEISVGGTRALKIAWISEGNISVWRVSTYFINNGTAYYLNFYESSYFKKPITLEEKLNNPPDLTAYNLILSTFKFTK